MKRPVHDLNMPDAKQFGLNMNKRKLKRIDWNIVKNIMKVLYDDGKMKKTNIAMRLGISYDNCLLYLDWLDTMDLIKRDIDDGGFELIGLDNKGRDLYTQKLQ